MVIKSPINNGIIEDVQKNENDEKKEKKDDK